MAVAGLRYWSHRGHCCHPAWPPHHLVLVIQEYSGSQPSDVHANSYPTMVQGGEGGLIDPLPQSFWYVVVFQNDFAFSEKPLIFSTRWGINYFMGGGAAGGLWHHQQWPPFWLPSWILPRIRNQVKTAINGNFLCWTCKITHKNKSPSFTFIVERSWKYMHFHSKKAWPSATYDIISYNHRNWK